MMKRASIKTTILIPVLAVLIIGVAAMVVIVGLIASSSTNHLTDNLMDAKVNEFTNKFEALGNYSYAAVEALMPVIEEHWREAQNGDVTRDEVVDLLYSVIDHDPNIFALLLCWEPDAFDGKDGAYAGTGGYNDDDGRFVPYLYRDGDTIYVEKVVGYEDPVFGLYYQGAKNSKKPYVTDPYSFEVSDGSTIIAYTITIPFVENGIVAGAFGIDVKMENVQTIMAEGSILSDGYMVVLSPDGSFATHRDASRVLENYKTTWLGAYANQVDDLLKNGGSLSVHAYSDVTNSYVRLLMNTIMIGNTGRYWSIMGIIPENTATASASQLILTVVAAGLILILLVGVLVFLLVSGSLKKLPSITAMAGNIAAGDLKMNTVSDKSPTKNEIALLERSFSGVVNVVNTLVSDIKEVGRAVLIDGDIEAAVDAEKYQGSYREVVESVNSMLQEQIKDTLQLLGCLNEYGNGNFDANVTKLPGKKIVMNETVDKLSYNLKSLSKDIDGLVQDAIQGKLASRVDVTDYQGDWAHLMTEMNTLLETIVAPINEASDVLGYVSAGNFDHQVQGNYQGDFIKIKDSINTTVTNVSSYISEISEVLTNLANNNLDQAVTREYVGSYASIKEALNNIIGTLNNVIGDIASAAEQVAAGARAISESSMAMATGATEQASSVEELNATIITINESTLRNSESAKDAENLSLQSKQNAASGDEDMKRMLDSINGIKESSNNIAKIIKSIEEIAFQTNLLALNAAVEAARAGEHGKGFMVVAEEVRNLASRSQTAAKETAALIDESVTRVNEGTEIADKTASALKTIVDDVSHVADLISNIANASHEQAEAISQVTDGLSHITEVVTNNSATSEEAASASQELSSQSEIMRNLVAVFKMK